MDVVLDEQELLHAGVGLLDRLVPYVLARLDLVGAVVQVALGVEVEVDDMVAQGGEQVLALLLADGERRSRDLGQFALPTSREGTGRAHRKYVGKNPRMSLKAISFQMTWFFICVSLIWLEFWWDHVWLAT